MGDMADMLIDRMFDEISFEEDIYSVSEKKVIQCRQCGKGGLKMNGYSWVMVRNINVIIMGIFII